MLVGRQRVRGPRVPGQRSRVRGPATWARDALPSTGPSLVPRLHRGHLASRSPAVPALDSRGPVAGGTKEALALPGLRSLPGGGPRGVRRSSPGRGARRQDCVSSHCPGPPSTGSYHVPGAAGPGLRCGPRRGPSGRARPPPLPGLRFPWSEVTPKRCDGLAASSPAQHCWWPRPHGAELGPPGRVGGVL